VNWSSSYKQQIRKVRELGVQIGAKQKLEREVKTEMT